MQKVKTIATPLLFLSFTAHMGTALAVPAVSGNIRGLFSVQLTVTTGCTINNGTVTQGNMGMVSEIPLFFAS